MQAICHIPDEPRLATHLNDIIKCLEAEAQEACANDSQNMHEATLAARHKKTTRREKTKMKCTNPNCLKTGHTSAKCWEKGGGAEAKAPEWFKELKAKQQRDKGNVATEQDNDYSTRSESAATFIHEAMEHKPQVGPCTKKYMNGDIPPTTDSCTIEWNDQTTRPPTFAAHVTPLTMDERALSTHTN